MNMRLVSRRSGRNVDEVILDGDPRVGSELLASIDQWENVDQPALSPSTEAPTARALKRANKQVKLGRAPAGVEISGRLIRVVHVSSGRHGSIELPEGAVVNGEIIEPEVVAAQLKALWSQARIPTRSVNIGVNNADVVARAVDLPELGAKDLRTSLRYELGDMIPFPVDSAMIDLRRITTFENDRKVAQTRVLAVAALRPMLRQYVATCRLARLSCRSIDYGPMALVRVARLIDHRSGTQAVVSVSEDLMTVALHQEGVVSFCRSIMTQGLASSVAGEIEDELSRIENYRTRASGGSQPETSFKRSDPIVAAIRGTIDYASIQPGALTVESMIVTGDPVRCQAIAEALRNDLAIPIALADPLGTDSQIVEGATFDPNATSAYATSYGLGLPGDDGPAGPTALELVPDREPITAPRAIAIRAGITAGAVLAVCLIATTIAGPDTSTANSALDEAAASRDEATVSLAGLTGFRKQGAEVKRLDQLVNSIGDVEIDWSRLLVDIRLGAPPQTTLLSISGAGPTTIGSQDVPGRLELVGRSAGQAGVSTWLENLARIPGIEEPTLEGISAADGGQSTFTITAGLGPESIRNAGTEPGSYLKTPETVTPQ